MITNPIEAILAVCGDSDAADRSARLLARYRTAGAVTTAKPAELARLGVSEEAQVVFRAARELAIDMARAALAAERTVLSSWDTAVAYLRATIGHLDHEHAHVLFLDRKNALIVAETIGVGTVDHAPVYPREIARRCLEVGASAIILAHNHPSGDVTPSRGDIDMTTQVQAALKTLGIALHDHLVIGPSSHASLRSLGHMGPG